MKMFVSLNTTEPVLEIQQHRWNDDLLLCAVGNALITVNKHTKAVTEVASKMDDFGYINNVKAKQARFDSVKGFSQFEFATGQNPIIIVADSNNHCLRVVAVKDDINDWFVGTFAGMCKQRNPHCQY